MSEENKNTTTPEQIPAFVKKVPELLPLWDFWVKEGKSALLTVIIIVAAVGAFHGVRNYLASRDAAANQALVNAFSIDDLEAAVSSYGSSKAGPALKLRLAKSYYDGERYQEALDLYTELAAKGEKFAAFVDVAEIGKAYALEGLAKYTEASAAYTAFVQDATKTNSYLALTAKLGVARCQALKGDKDGAVKSLEALKKTLADDKIAEMRVERLTDAIKHYDAKRPARSLFDAADAAEKAIAAEKKPDVKAEAPKAAPKVAPKAEAPKAASKTEAPKATPKAANK